jgi:hypothetical protein
VTGISIFFLERPFRKKPGNWREHRYIREDGRQQFSPVGRAAENLSGKRLYAIDFLIIIISYSVIAPAKKIDVNAPVF